MSILFVSGMNCPDDEYLLNNFCYKDCPLNFFASNENMTISINGSDELQATSVCTQCSIICSHCFGPRQNECLACASGFELTPNYTCARKMMIPRLGSHFSPIWLATIAIIACISPVILFLMIFGLLQAKDHQYVCFRKTVRYVDLKTYSGIQLGTPEQGLLDGESDYDDDIEIQISEANHKSHGITEDSTD